MRTITTRRTQIPRFGSRELAIPELDGLDINLIRVTAEDGREYKIKAGGKPGIYIISFIDATPGMIVTLKFEIAVEIIPDQPRLRLDKPETMDLSDSLPDKPVEPPAKKIKTSFFKKLQKKQNRRIELNQEEIAAIRTVNLNHRNIAGKKVLTIDFTGCWARGLGMIQKAKQLQYELKVPLYDYFDRITGQGDGAVIAAALALGIDLDGLGAWWIGDWRKVHRPGIGQKALRWGVSKIKPNASGYNAKSATTALRKLFLKTKADSRMRDTLTELQITVIQGDMKITTRLSSDHPALEIYAAVEDSAVTKIHYNQGQTIKGEAVFLGAIEKNDALGLLISEDNKKLRVTSIGAPVRINPPGAKKLKFWGHAADKVALQSAGHFYYDQRVKQIIAKLKAAGYDIGYRRLECSPIDNIVCNNTSEAAMRLGIESGSGPLNFLKG